MIDHPASTRIDASAVQVAHRISQVHVIAQIEKLRAELNALRFGDGEHTGKAEIQTDLPWTSQDITPDSPNIGSYCVRESCSARAWNWLTRADHRADEGVRIKAISTRYVAGRGGAISTGREIRPSKSVVQSIK